MSEQVKEEGSFKIKKKPKQLVKNDIIKVDLSKKEEPKTEQVAPAQQPVINLNVQQNQENKQKVENGGNTIIRERVIEKPAAAQPVEPVKPVKKEEESW